MQINSFIFILFFSVFSLAEYRVFQLKVYKEVNSNETPGDRAPQTKEIIQEEDIKIFLSNLDPEQYVGYYPLEKGEKIKYIDTWMCRGRTNGKDFCPNPRPKTIAPEGDSLNSK